MNKKEVYYNNTVYRVTLDTVKFINGVDVVQLPNNLIVYWSDLEQKWKMADLNLIELYTNKKSIDIEFNNEIIKVISHLDLNEEIENVKVTSVKIDCLVYFDNEKNVWKLLDKNHNLYQIYTNKKCL